MKRYLITVLFLLPVLLFSQQTAGEFFKNISSNYAEIEGYTAHFKFTSGIRSNIIQEGTISYMAPNLLRLDYDSPKDQVLCVNGTKMSLYVPTLGTLYEQTINTEEGVLETSGFTSQGLSLFYTNYSISYLNGPELEELDEDNPEEVYKLRLIRRKASEPFRRIVMSITAEGYIRRLESLKNNDEVLILDIVGLDSTVRLSKNLFDYDSPPTASTIPDFLFTPEDE
ncbi:MAG: hypothetical protein B6229_10645 [Spirochaetaceae bacterium 4572_7]|nr:MAG: hypothetical protein B6229_10645 [Spirochaetaceae bacterium 4572_7]